MSDNQGDDSAAREAVEAHHASVYEANLELELALASPVIDLPSWLKQVELELLELRQAVEEHHLEVERPGGLYEEVVARAPRLARRIEKLRTEHKELLEGIARATADLQILEHDPPKAARIVRDDCMELFTRVSRHRHDSSDLVFEAYYEDIGSGD